MTRATFLFCLALASAAGQPSSVTETGEGFVALFNGRDLGQWVGNRRNWKVERGLLTGVSDGKSGAALTLSAREYGDFELRFDLRVKQGAGRVRVRGTDMGPVGVELAVDASMVRWLVNGSPFDVVSRVDPGEWNAYRVVCKGDSFDLTHNQVKSAYTLVAGHLAPGGKLSLIMPAGVSSHVEFRNIRLKNIGKE